MPPDERRYNLLVVDDEPAMLQGLRHLFARDYRVLTAEGGRSALDLLGREDVDAILSDQRMPGMNGDALLAQAQHVRPDAVRMLMTGYADIQSIIGAVNSGQIYRYVLKPFDPAELEGIVRQAVAHHELVVDRRRLVEELREARQRLARMDAEFREAVELKRALLETGRLRADLEDLGRRVGDLEDSGRPVVAHPPAAG